MRRRSLAGWLGRCAALACGLTLAAAAAHAQAARGDDPEALIARGIELREQGKDDQALELFRKADALAPSPRSRAQVGLAEQALGIWVSAETHIEAALAAKGDPWIERYRAALTSALATIRQHVGLLEIRGGVSGADVYVDGARVGSLPMTSPWHVEVGRRSIDVRASGYHTASRATDIAPGQTTRETIELVREETPNPRGAGGAGGEVKGPIVIEPPRGGVQKTLGWIFVGTGGAFLATGVVGLVARQSAVNAYNDDKDCPGFGSPNQPAVCQDRISTADTWRTISIASFIAGGVLAVGGAVLVLTAPSSASRHAARAGCAPAGLGFACVGTF